MSRGGRSARAPRGQLDLFAAGEPRSLETKVREVHARLCREYGCPIPYFHALDPLSELVSALLSHRTRNRHTGQAFRALRARYGAVGEGSGAIDEETWLRVMEAPPEELEQVIAAVTWPEQKARVIPAVLREIARRRGGSLALDFLGALPVPQARRWLESISGVGPKTSAAVLAFSRRRKRALPVDSHHYRVANRLGLIEPDATLVEAHETLEGLLPASWDAQAVYDHHEVLMLHGQRCCFPDRPDCARCPVLDLCPSGQARRADGPPPSSPAKPRAA